MSFGDKLKQLREEKNLTQKELALKLGVTQRTISYYENNTSKPTNIQFLTNLANILGITLDDLIDSEEDKNNSKVHRLIAKLIRDTANYNLRWVNSETAFLNDYSSDEENRFLYYFETQEFFFLKNAEIDYKHSYIAKYKNGAYLVLKYTISKGEDSFVNFALFIFSRLKAEYYYVVNNNTLETLEDLYLSIQSVDSYVDDLIDTYLKDDFKKDHKSTFVPFDEEIPF